MSEREQYGKLADELQDRVDTLADQNEQLGEQIADVRTEWERKRADGVIVGATPDWDDPNEDEDDDKDDEDDEEEEEDGDKDDDDDD